MNKQTVVVTRDSGIVVKGKVATESVMSLAAFYDNLSDASNTFQNLFPNFPQFKVHLKSLAKDGIGRVDDFITGINSILEFDGDTDSFEDFEWDFYVKVITNNQGDF